MAAASAAPNSVAALVPSLPPNTRIVNAAEPELEVVKPGYPNLPRAGSPAWFRMLATIAHEGMSLEEGLEIASYNRGMGVHWP